MAGLNTFSFRPGHSSLHRLDARVKLLGLMLISILTLRAGSVSLAFLTILLIVLAADCALSLPRLAGELKYFFLLLLLVFVARALSTPGHAVLQLKGVSVTSQGLLAGGLVCWRLLIIITGSLLLVISTRTSRITGAVQWYFKPVPFLDETRIALMMGLVVRFIPGLLLRAAETADAQRARCVENRKNPVYRVRVLVIPFLRNIFLEADELVQAMEARGYTGRRTAPEFLMRKTDWLALVFIGIISFSLIVY